MRLRVRASLAFPLAGVDWWRKVAVGGATGLLLELVFVGLAYLVSEEAAFGVAPLVVILNLPAVGYILQVYRATLQWEDGALPEWERWPALVQSGLVGFGILLAYGLLPLLLLLTGLGLLVQGGVLLFLGMVVMVLGVLAGILTLFFLPMALARYLAKRRVELAFHPGAVWDGINAVLVEYVSAYLLSVASYVLAALVAVLPYVGPLVWPFLWFYLVLAQAHLFGEICARAS
ncbi:MAG: DUF4013 domain-containing protein [Candidatus Methylomirabilales bacterium]